MLKPPVNPPIDPTPWLTALEPLGIPLLVVTIIGYVALVVLVYRYKSLFSRDEQFKLKGLVDALFVLLVFGVLGSLAGFAALHLIRFLRKRSYENQSSYRVSGYNSKFNSSA